MSLFKQSISLFPISVKMDLPVYVRGIKIRTLDLLTSYNYETKILEEVPGIKMFKRFQSTAPSYQELHLYVDILKDLVKNNQLDKEYLTNLHKQAAFISKTFKCACSIAQLKRFYSKKNPVKARLKRVKKFQKNESH